MPGEKTIDEKKCPGWQEKMNALCFPHLRLSMTKYDCLISQDEEANTRP